ncbi:type II secretion system protein, partial [bacterium]|nr:type II secretion system protein [bacterium]
MNKQKCSVKYTEESFFLRDSVRGNIEVGANPVRGNHTTAGTFPSPLVGEGLGVRGVPARGNHTTTKTFPSLARTLPSKQSGELFARGKVGMGGSICHIKQPTPTLPNHGGRKAAFTLAEGATHTNTPPLVAKAAFTLAEVLITLAIIGVVAALTLPTLIAKVNEKVDQNQIKVTRAKLFQGIKMLDLHGGVNNTYSSTAEFVEELSKYMKITKICDGSTTSFS